jgi:exopolysaccharide production protein ExoZ
MVVSCWPEFGKQCAARRFMVRRLVRIVPLYWLATLLMMLLVYFGTNEVPNPRNVIESLFFYPFADGRPVVRAGWTLNFEMMFYAILCLGLSDAAATGGYHRLDDFGDPRDSRLGAGSCGP